MFKKLRSILSLVLASLICFNVPGNTTDLSTREVNAIHEFFDGTQNITNLRGAHILHTLGDHEGRINNLRNLINGCGRIRGIRGEIDDLLARIRHLEARPAAAPAPGFNPALTPINAKLAQHDQSLAGLDRRLTALETRPAFDPTNLINRLNTLERGYGAYSQPVAFNARFDARFRDPNFVRSIFNPMFRDAFQNIFTDGGFDFTLFDQRVTNLINGAGVGGRLDQHDQDLAGLTRRLTALENRPAFDPTSLTNRLTALENGYGAYSQVGAFNTRFDTRFDARFDGAFDARFQHPDFIRNIFRPLFRDEFQNEFQNIFNDGGFDFNLFDQRVNNLIRDAGVVSAEDFNDLRDRFGTYSQEGAFNARFDARFDGAFDARFDGAFDARFRDPSFVTNIFNPLFRTEFQNEFQNIFNDGGFDFNLFDQRVNNLIRDAGVVSAEDFNDLRDRFGAYSQEGAFNARFDARFDGAFDARFQNPDFVTNIFNPLFRTEFQNIFGDGSDLNLFDQRVNNLIRDAGVVSAEDLAALTRRVDDLGDQFGRRLDDFGGRLDDYGSDLADLTRRLGAAEIKSNQALTLANRAIADHAAQRAHNDAQQDKNNNQQRDNADQRNNNAEQQRANDVQQGRNDNQQALNDAQQDRNDNQQALNAEQRAHNDNQQALNVAQQGRNDNQQALNVAQQGYNAEQQRDNADQRAHNADQRVHNAEQRAHNDAQQILNDQTLAEIQRAQAAAERSELSAQEYSIQAQNYANQSRTSLTNVISAADGVQTAHEAIIRHMHAMFGGIPKHIKTTGDGAFLHIAGTETLNLEPGLVLKDHSASGAGGAGAVKGNASLDLPNVKVFDNKAGTFGGAFIVGGDAKLSLRSSAKGGVTIAGNKAGGKDNSIHFTGNGEVKLNTINKIASIKIYDPMTDDGATVNAKLNVLGAGTTKLYATSSLNNTDIDVNGHLQLKNGAGLTARTITVSNGSQFSAVSGKKSDINAQNLRVNGNIAVEVFGDGSNDTINAGNVTFAPTSSLEINLDSRRFDEVDFEILRSSAIVGNIGDVSVLGGGKGHLMILRPNAIIAKIQGIGRQTSMSSMSNLTKNQKAVATVLDNMSSSSQKGQDIDFIIDRVDHLSAVNAKAAEQALSQLNGYFLANVIRDITNNSGDKDAIYSRMNTRVVDNKADVWGEIKGDYTEFAGDANSLGDHKDTEIGAIIGYDRYLTKGRFANKLLLGAYSKINKHYVSQSANNDGEMTNAGLGLIALYNENTWEAKAIIDGSYDLYSTKRHVQFEKTDRTAKANFSGMGIGFDIEGALKKDLGNQYALRPYIGFEARVNYYGDIQEKGASDLGLTVDGGSYNRMFARTGVGIKRNVNDKYDWNANIEYKHLLTDTIPTIVSRFGNTSETFESLGSEEGRSIIGVGAGSSYKVSDSVTIFANANINAAEKFKNVQGNIGTSYKFGMPKKEKRKLTKEEKEVVKVKEQVNNLIYKKLSNKLKTYVQH